MPESPGEFGDSLNKALDAWRRLRPTKKFANLTLDEFRIKVKASLDTRAHIKTLQDQLDAEQTRRATADVETGKWLEFVVNSVKGDPEEGEDGELYEGFGYIRKSNRKTGLTRKKKPPA